jgi:hypothetical protein
MRVPWLPSSCGRCLSSTGAPQLYQNIILHIAGDTRNPEEFVRKYALVGRSTLQKVLDGLGCDVVQVPGTDQLVSFDALELHDNMLLTALRYSVPWDARVGCRVLLLLLEHEGLR